MREDMSNSLDYLLVPQGDKGLPLLFAISDGVEIVYRT